jgi:hypothetical protein
MPPRPVQRQKSKSPRPPAPPSPFAPSAFLKGTPEAVKALCESLAGIAHDRFSDLTGTSWPRVGTDLAQQLRAAGHDLRAFDDAEDMQQWEATFYHPRGTFSLFLSFRAPTSVEVTWQSDDGAITARRP